MTVQSFDIARLDAVSNDAKLRVLTSACLVGERTGWEGDAYTAALVVRLASLPCVHAVPFCPEHLTLGTPRPLTTIHDGDGRDVLRGHARVLETTGRDVTEAIVRGARAMRDLAVRERVDLAVLTDVSDSCGSQAIYLGDPAERRYQRGFGVAAALIAEAGIPIVAQRDARTLSCIVAALDRSFVPDPQALDFVESQWFVDYFAEGSPGLPLAELERRKT